MLMEVHCEFEERILEMKIFRTEEEVRDGEGERYTCTLCGERFGHRAEVRIHVVRDHPDVYRSILEGTEVRRRCPMEGCGDEMEGEEAVRKHLEEMHGEDCFRCPECENVMLSPEEMEEHWEKIHGGEERDEEGEKEVEGTWMWSWKAERGGGGGVIGEEERMKVRNQWMVVHSKYSEMRVSGEICGLGRNFERYRKHLSKVHGVVEENWRCEICEREGKRYGAMVAAIGGLRSRESWLTHLERSHGDEVDMEGMVERARKINVKGGVEGLDKVHWKTWTNGRLVKEKKKKDNPKRKGKRKIKRAIREIKVKELKLSERLVEMGRELEREKRLVIGPLERVKERKREILNLDVNS